ncbi:MAG: chromosome segregation protein SMC [Acidimicrobiia bacterium]|nr:chromosome segregation protein SMC [Acidimicrobiia bacterium]MBT8193194.1 chromosome segregation protein SMC [Acidimicrobiia bacterium]NNL97251.1 chromosome segregation protein SMC [Acidimicrobiia bacterium]
MFLKTLRIHGFKSFADRTRLELEPGVTVIVGPNGSGKSNVVDAISWVLGTQATKHLRTDKMEEVIFAGTTTRPAHRVAEVVLTFDNSERRLPLDLSEVTIGRRLHNDGTSEYEINGTPCRLLDISELLSDGGVGRHQHVIINQGQVASILNAGPDEHRAIIEEAAGVLKHRNRRRRAARRLERTHVDVQRLEDIHKELLRQMRPLKRQANAAARYDDVRTTARGLRLYLGGRELAEIEDRLTEARAQEGTAAIREERDTVALQELESRLESLETAAGESGRALQRDTAAAARLETTSERLQRIAQVAHERHRSLTSGAEQAGERHDDLLAEASGIVEDLAAAAAEEEQAGATAGRAEIALQALEDEERSLAEQETLPVEGVIATLRGDLQALEAAGARDGREMTATAHRLEIVTESVERDGTAAEELREEIRRMDKEAGAQQEAYEAARSIREVAESEWQRLEMDLADQTRLVSAARARVEALEQAGVVNPDVLAEAARLEGVGEAVATVLDIPDHLADAVGAALGPWAEALVATPGGLADAVAELKSRQLGGMPFVVGGVKGSDARVLPSDIPGRPIIELLGPAADAVVARRLLSDVVLADSWSAAWSFVQAHPQLRAVTAEGDLVTIAGIRISAGEDGLGVTLARAREDLSQAETGLARATSRETSARRSLHDHREDERSQLEALEAVEVRMSGAVETLDRAERSVTEGEAELIRLQDRRSALEEGELHRTERLVELRGRLDDLEGEEAARQAAWEALSRRRQEIADRREQSRRLREQSAAALGAATERRKLLETRRVAVERELEQAIGFHVDPADMVRLERVESAARAALDHVSAHITILRARQAELRQTSGEAVRRLDEARQNASNLSKQIAGSKETRSNLAVEIEGLRVRRESVAEGLRRDLDASVEQAIAAPPVEVPENTAPIAHLESLEADLRRMGPVNPLAAQEYEDLSERASFLDGQLSDLRESAHELEKVIKALDDEMATLFADAFQDISALYAENFSLLFPGGRGQLSLSDPGDHLNTGVEIEAQPLGKKVSRLSLLSGGERSLAALAFLFAVFRARPSPFYVLDEVEAALDDANLHRFLRLVELLRDSAQVIIVTHQQQTMEGADTLYGITMEPGGSTQVVAKRLSNVTV